MAFVAPMLMAFIFSSAFGGAGEFEIEKIKLGVVNHDQPSYGFSAGDLVQDFLTGGELGGLISSTVFLSEEDALDAIKAQDIQVAVVVPRELSASVTGESEPSQLHLVHDPAASLAPQIIESVLAQMTDGFSGAKIANNLTAYELQSRGFALDPALIQTITAGYAQAAEETSEEKTGYAVSPPQDEEGAGRSLQEQIVSGVMASMMIFFTFFTGAYGAESLLDEEAEGTLARKMTSPTNLAVILGGKSLGIILILLVQMTVLITSSMIIFGIDWGNLVNILIAILATTAASAGLGLFLMSLVKDRRQTGIIFGGVMTVMGMGGGLFTAGIENPPAFLKTISSFTPQGWASRVWTLVQSNAQMGELLGSASILALTGAALFFLGVLIFRRRFAG
jgi:ABC-2 type transport system permease protein